MAPRARQRPSWRRGGPVIPAALLAAVVACAGHQPPQDADTAPETEQETCGRAEAAARFSLVFFEAMGDMGEACANGDVLACNPANYAIGGLAGVVFMPMGFVIGLASPEIEAQHCAAVRRRKAAKRQPETPEEKRAQLWVRAAEGDAEAQFEVGEQLFEDETRESRRAAWYWYCRAAHQRHAEAQYRLGGFYQNRTGPGHPGPPPGLPLVRVGGRPAFFGRRR